LPLKTPTARTNACSASCAAAAYVRHPVLGPRLIECAGILDATRGRSADQVFGGVDTKKLQSSMTLFLRAAPHEPVFARVLERYFAGTPDRATDQRLRVGPRE
jgi:uncharacterized protein (DUF1810 family)